MTLRWRRNQLRCTVVDHVASFPCAWRLQQVHRRIHRRKAVCVTSIYGKDFVESHLKNHYVVVTFLFEELKESSPVSMALGEAVYKGQRRICSWSERNKQFSLCSDPWISETSLKLWRYQTNDGHTSIPAQSRSFRDGGVSPLCSPWGTSGRKHKITAVDWGGGISSPVVGPR